MPDDKTRDRIRELVREVLSRTATEQVDSKTTDKSAPPPPTRFVNTVANTITQATPTYDESSKRVITEDDVRGLPAGSTLRIAENARLTPLAADIVSERKIEVIRRVPRRGSTNSRLIAIGSDHGGFQMKEELRNFLKELGHRVQDFGTYSEQPVDYPDFAHSVARAVSDGQADVGIIIDGAGVGSAMTANKVPGVRAAACYSAAVARNSREHNGANVLALGSKTVSTAEMKEIVTTWLGTEISEERHKKRVAKIDAIQRQYQR